MFILFASIVFTKTVLFFLQELDTDVAVLVRDKNKAMKCVHGKVTHHPLHDICIIGRVLS